MDIPLKLLALPLVAVALLAGLLAGCIADPSETYEIPNVGTAYTAPPASVADIYTLADGRQPEVPQGEIGISKVDPASGSPAGGETVFIHGWGFVKGVDVYFDDEPSDDVFYVNSKKLRVVTPTHALGFADIAVRWPDDRVKLLTSGFLYKTDLKVDEIQPPLGPKAGGTPITVVGSGFTPGAKLIIGHRLALQIEVVDHNTMFAVTPPGTQGGPVDVFVSSPAGVVTLKDGYTFTVLPEADAVEPAAGPAAGGEVVAVTGRFLAPVTTVLFGEQEATILELQSDKVVVEVPPGQAGFVDVVTVGQWGWDVVSSGYLYLDEDPPSGIQAVIPEQGPDVGGNSVTIVGCEIAAGDVTAVSFGIKTAEILQVVPAQCSVVVAAPPGNGLVNITVKSDAGEFEAEDAYAYEPTLSVTAVTPNVGSHMGGTSIEIEGYPFQEGLQVLVGPMPASEVTFVDKWTLRVVTPPGSPGLADITVVAPGSTATMKNAFLFAVKKPEAWVVTPVYGSRAGGTYVEVIGSGFTAGALLFFGEGLATGVKVKNYGRITGYSPPNAVGTYDVTVTVDQGQALMPAAYSYFDPTSWYGGAWGSPIDGAMNVTVFEAGQWAPLEGATVVLGSDPDTKYKGITDSNGHVTLSGPGLVGPVDIHAAKKQHDAASFIHVGAENATLYLIPYNPPSTGPPTEPPPALPPGSVAGRVVGLGKYVVVPPGDCKNKESDPGGLCYACIDDEDCYGEGSCLAIGKTGKYCTYGCDESAADCPNGYICAPAGESGSHCIPALGKKAARCELSTTSIYEINYGGDPFVPTDDDSFYKLADTRLGEVAVICLGGWVDFDTGEFFPMAMGVKRHVNIKPGEEKFDQNVWLNIPLTRELRLRLHEPPKFENYEGTYQVTAFLDFGSDGLFKLPNRFQGASPEDVILSHLPAELTGDLFDASYILHAGAYTNSEDQTPYSVILLTDIKDIDETSAAAFSQGEFASLTGAPADEAINAAWTTESGTYLVSDEGRVFLYKEGNFYQLPSVVDDDLNDIYGFPGKVMYAVGDNGVVVHYNGLAWSLVGHATDMPLRSVWGSDPDDIHAVGKYRIASYYQKQWHELKVSFDLHGVSGNGPDNVWAVGTKGTVLFYEGLGWALVESPTEADLYAVQVWDNGDVLVAGDGVAFLRQQGEWVDLELDPGFTARSISGTQGDFYVAGSPGVVAHWLDGVGFNYIAAPESLMVNDVFIGQDDSPVAVGAPALLLKPFIPFQKFASPVDGGAMAPLYIDWDYDGDSDPITLHTVGLTERTGKSLWRIVADGKISSISLPDFQLLAGVNPLPPGPEKRLRIYSAFAPEFSIDSFDLTDLGTLYWTSWAYEMIDFQ